MCHVGLVLSTYHWSFVEHELVCGVETLYDLHGAFADRDFTKLNLVFDCLANELVFPEDLVFDESCPDYSASHFACMDTNLQLNVSDLSWLLV